MRLNRVVLASLTVLALSTVVMAQQTHTLNVPQQTWPAGETVLTSGVSAPGGQYSASFSPTVTGTGNDWATPGRTLHIVVQESLDGGQTWLPDTNQGNDFATGSYGKGGAPNPPVINMSTFFPGKSVKVRVSVVCSAPITCGLTASVTAN